MRNVKLLDCTLRDGGYLNDWEFGHEVISNIFERSVSAGVDVIEIGFLDEHREFDINRTIMPNTQSVEKIYGKMDKGSAMIVGMIDYGKCDIDNIQLCSESYLDGIRVIFKENLMYEALQFCKEIKEKGYKVFAQLVSVTTYTDQKLVELIEIVNEIEPFALSMVDTYGLLHQNNLMHIFQILDKDLKPEIGLGYHAHNNFQMGYANAIEIMNTNTKRMILIDGSLYGMGKSAGNTPIELLAMYLNDNFGKKYDIGQMLEAIENSIIEIQNRVQWGYNLFYYVAASTKCHPNYVSYFMNKRTLSMKAIGELLLTIEDEKKLLYDAKYAEERYIEFQKSELDDTKALNELEENLSGEKVLVLGPGKTIGNERETIVSFLEKNTPVVFAINYIPKGFHPEYVFVTNSKRYIQLKSVLNENENRNINIIATSNVSKTRGNFGYEINYEGLIDEKASIPDNSLIMLLRIFEKIGVKQITLAGFDGYSEREMNYFNTNMEYGFVREKANELNTYVKKYLKTVEGKLEISFLTKTYYTK